MRMAFYDHRVFRGWARCATNYDTFGLLCFGVFNVDIVTAEASLDRASAIVQFGHDALRHEISVTSDLSSYPLSLPPEGPIRYVGIVHKWLPHGSLYNGSDHNTGTYINFHHSGDNNLRQLPFLGEARAQEEPLALSFCLPT